MDIRRQLTVPCAPARLFAWVEDLGVYPQWMDLAHHVERTDDGQAAWQVELRANVGPFARSKVLRMERTEHKADQVVTFERRETDGRAHSPWTLRATIERPDIDASASQLTMELRYGGSLWSGVVLQRVLDDAITRASDRLIEVVSAEPRR